MEAPSCGTGGSDRLARCPEAPRVGLARDAAGRDLVQHVTEIHAPTSEAEQQRLKTIWAVREHVFKNWDWVMRELLASEMKLPVPGLGKASSDDAIISSDGGSCSV